MSAEENKTIYRRLIEDVFNARDVTRADAFIAADLVDHTAFPGQAPGLAGWQQTRGALLAAFRDVQVRVEDQVAERDMLANRFIFRGAHGEDFMGIPATGKPIVLTGIDIVRFAGGKIVEHWVVRDDLGLLQQLGVIPAPDQTRQ